MLSQILPGLREVRGPLAAGFVWLLLSWLIFHGDVSKAHGTVKELVELGEKLHPAALATVASFVAYLVGALSDDLFGGLLRLLIKAPDILTDVTQRLRGEQASFPDPATATPGRFEELSAAYREAQLVRIENEADRSLAESDLRFAILPPLIALLLYLSITDRPWWLFGLLFVGAFGLQAAMQMQDTMIAQQSLYTSRREAGVPPSSVAEASAGVGLSSTGDGGATTEA